MADDNVLALGQVDKTCNPDVVEVLENCLALAVAGDLRNVVVISEYRGGDYYEDAAFENGTLLLGSISRAEYAVHTRMNGEH